jgi:hypothetical protein
MRWLAALALLLPAQEEEIQLDLLNKENVIASRLEGRWKMSPELSVGRPPPVPGELVFAYDRTAVPEAALRKMAGRAKTKLTLYAVGRATRFGTTEQSPFALTFWNGNPTLLFFEPDKGDPFGKWGGVRVSLARAKETKDDVFFMTVGDHETGPSYAFERVP